MKSLLTRAFSTTRFILFVIATFVAGLILASDISFVSEQGYIWEVLALIAPATIPYNIGYFLAVTFLILVLNYQLRSYFFKDVTDARELTRMDDRLYIQLAIEGCYILGLATCTFGINHWSAYLVGGYFILLAALMWLAVRHSPKVTTFGELYGRGG